MTGALVHQEAVCWNADSTSMSSSAPAPPVTNDGEKKEESEALPFRSEIVSAVAEEEDHAHTEKFARRHKFREVERALFEARLASVPQRLTAGEKATAEAAEVASMAEQLEVANNEKQHLVDRLRASTEADEAEISRLVAERLSNDEHDSDERAELEELQTHVTAQKFLCQEAEHGVQTAIKEVRQQRVCRQWAMLSETLLRRALAEVLIAAEEEICESTRSTIAITESWQARCINNSVDDAKQLEEVDSLCSRADVLKKEVELALAELLALAWRSRSHSVTSASWDA